jgi:hypothetical protein
MAQCARRAMMMKEIALDWAVVIVSVGFGYGLRIPHPIPSASLFSSFSEIYS